jgi:hypothetical protein
MIKRQVKYAFVRIQTYTARAELAVEAGNYAQALADTAEISEIAHRVWELIQRETALNDQI